ncbi:ABC transporter substrate-binding protein [Streptosporangium sp. NPDC004379]|uniref:ABC transporter substrate-binding protein n=1 Tax=Streptosporangium sp. NPDC004379 TaxID=3366189 RepID=UPI0036B14307
MVVDPRRFDRRTLLRGAGALGAAAFTASLTGCAETGAGQGAKAGAGSAPLLTVASEQGSTLARNFNPFAASSRWAARFCVYEPLMIFNHVTGALEPWLATGFTWSQENTVLTMKLRDKVTWSDGRPFTAEDVTFTFDLLKRHKGLIGYATGAVANYVEAVRAPDAGTVEFTFKKAYTPALHDIAQQLLVPRHIWSAVADPVTHTNPDPVGTGPFTLTAFRPQMYELRRRDGYWQPIAIPGLRVPTYAGNDQINSALVSGQVDWGGLVPDPDRTFVAKDRRNNHYWWPRISDIFLFVNTTKAPFDDPAVRKALSMALDRRKMVDIAVWGKSEPANAVGIARDAYPGWIDESLTSTHAELVTRDVAAANAALDAAGLARGAGGRRTGKDGEPASFDLVVPSGWTDFVAVAQIVTQNLAEVGVTVKLRTIGFDQWTSAVYNGRFDVTLGPGERGASPFGYFRAMMSSFTRRPVGETSNLNFHRLAVPEADELLERFATVSDAAEQRKIGRELQKLFVEVFPAVPLYEQPEWGAYSSRRFTGWPDAGAPYAPLRNSPRFPTPLLVYPKLKPAT